MAGNRTSSAFIKDSSRLLRVQPRVSLAVPHLPCQALSVSYAGNTFPLTFPWGSSLLTHRPMGTRCWVKWSPTWARYSGWRWWWTSPWRSFMKSLWSAWRPWASGTPMSRRSRWGGPIGRAAAAVGRGLRRAGGGASSPTCLSSVSGSLWPGRSCRRLEKTRSSLTSWLQRRQETSWGPETLWVCAVPSAGAPCACWLARPHSTRRCPSRRVSSGNTGSSPQSSQ